MRWILALLLCLIPSVAGAYDNSTTLHVLWTPATLQITWQSPEQVCAWFVSPVNGETQLNDTCSTEGAITVPQRAYSNAVQEYVVLRSAIKEFARTAVVPLLPFYAADVQHLIVPWRSDTTVCAYAGSGSAWTSLQGDLPCRASGSFAMPRTGDVGYTALRGHTLIILGTDGQIQSKAPIPAPFIVAMPIIGVP